MGKLKTHKATAKRFKITKTGKVIQRTSGQGHFNARESGKKMRNKRADHQVARPERKRIIRAIAK